MTLQFTGDLFDTAIAVRQTRGALSHCKGLSAEEQVARHYERAGLHLLHRRWRGEFGELDLIFADGDEVVFVEVKSSKTHASALNLVSERQVARLCSAAEEFLGQCPKGSLTPMRLDIATVDGLGRVDVLENALMTF